MFWVIIWKWWGTGCPSSWIN